MKRKGNNQKKIHGDFQTPLGLAKKVCQLLERLHIYPQMIIEPTCGTGAFLDAALEIFPNTKCIGMDINAEYIEKVKNHLKTLNQSDKVSLQVADFFTTDWQSIIAQAPKPLLILGNPPWITSADISSREGKNLPHKENLFQYSGLEAKLGRSNFDIAEWIIYQSLKQLNNTTSILSMLCKFTTARKIAINCFKQNFSFDLFNIYLINAKEEFGVDVEACLLLCRLTPNSTTNTCHLFENLNASQPIKVLGFKNNCLIANIAKYNAFSSLDGHCSYSWRSGIKHDCSSVLELKKVENNFVNSSYESVEIEANYLFPLLKSADLANNRQNNASKWLLVTQTNVGEDTAHIQGDAPKTWDYLTSHHEFFLKRKSSVYQKQPQFAIFGVGEYSFMPWKVAISALYKHLHFNVVGSLFDKPVVFDDTCYFLSVATYEEAIMLYTLFNRPEAREFFESLIFWDAKRPITKNLLQKLNLQALIRKTSVQEIKREILGQYPTINPDRINSLLTQLSLQ